MARQRPLHETERAVEQKLAALPIDHQAMAGVANIYRAAGAVRNHFERTVLAPHGLTWTAWVVLWVVWIWEEIESRHVAAEAGISKGTLTGVAGTLQSRGLLNRRTHPDDARRVLLALSPQGATLMNGLYAAFNAQEVIVTQDLSPEELRVLSGGLRKIVLGLEQHRPARKSS